MTSHELTIENAAQLLTAAGWAAAGQRPGDGAWVFHWLGTTRGATRFITAATLAEAMERLLTELTPHAAAGSVDHQDEGKAPRWRRSRRQRTGRLPPRVHR